MSCSRPHSRCSPGPTSPDMWRWSPAGRRRRPPGGWDGSGARSTLIASVGRDAAGRALVDVLRADKVTPRVTRVAGARTGRIGVLVAPDGERSFVADRGAADALRPGDLQADWFAGADALHLPVYSLIGHPLGEAGLRAIELARAAGAVVSLDLASIGPLLADGRRAARERIDGIAPDLLFATAAEAEAFLGHHAVEGLLESAAIAVVKRGAKGATVLARDGDASESASRSPRNVVRPRTRRARATRSTPGSWSAGSGRARAGGPSRHRCIGRRWPVIAPRAGRSRRRVRSCPSPSPAGSGRTRRASAPAGRSGGQDAPRWRRRGTRRDRGRTRRSGPAP